MNLIQVLLSYLTQQNELLDCLTVQANRYIMSYAVWTSGKLNLGRYCETFYRFKSIGAVLTTLLAPWLSV